MKHEIHLFSKEGAPFLMMAAFVLLLILSKRPTEKSQPVASIGVRG